MSTHYTGQTESTDHYHDGLSTQAIPIFVRASYDHRKCLNILTENDRPDAPDADARLSQMALTLSHKSGLEIDREDLKTYMEDMLLTGDTDIETVQAKLREQGPYWKQFTTDLSANPYLYVTQLGMYNHLQRYVAAKVLDFNSHFRDTYLQNIASQLGSGAVPREVSLLQRRGEVEWRTRLGETLDDVVAVLDDKSIPIKTLRDRTVLDFDSLHPAIQVAFSPSFFPHTYRKGKIWRQNRADAAANALKYAMAFTTLYAFQNDVTGELFPYYYHQDADGKPLPVWHGSAPPPEC